MEASVMRADSLCLEPLLQYGIPLSENVDCILREIDDQLAQNSKQLEECVKSIMDASNDFTDPDGSYNHPTDALNYLVDNRSLDNTACYDPEPASISELIKLQLAQLEKYPGCEEALLDQLLKFSSKEGVSLPIRSSAADPMSASVLSINTAVDESEHINEALWNQLCMALSKCFAEKLTSLPFGQPKLGCFRKRRLKYVQSLCTLFPLKDVWHKYRNIRSKQLASFLVLNSHDEQRLIPFLDSVRIFEGHSPNIVSMINEDFELLNSGVFGNVITPFKGISEVYFDRLLDEISTIVHFLQEELLQVSQRKEQKRYDGKKETKDMLKSNSEAGFLGHLKGNLRKQQSKSMDSLLDQGNEPFTNLQVLLSDYIDGVVCLVRVLLGMEHHIDALYNSLVWEVTDTTGQQPREKKTLRSVLKSRNKSDDKKQLFSQRSFEKSGLLPESIPPPYGTSQAIIAEMSASLKVVEKPYEDRPHWEWRALLRKFAGDLASCVDGCIRSTASHIISDLTKLPQEHLQAVQVDTMLAGGRLDYPKLISKAVNNLITCLDHLLPLAEAGSDGPFMTVRSAFVDATHLALKNVNLYIAKFCSSPPSDLPKQQLYLLLSDVTYIRNYILNYEKIIGLEENGVNGSPLQGLYDQYCQQVDVITQQVVQQHTHVISTTILHDAESQHFSDTKEFYEGERCSFYIQMWYFYMKATRHDLWRICPPKQAKLIFVAVLQDSLHILAFRYSNTKPSFRRIKQFRCDLTTILLLSSELLLLSGFESIETLLSPTLDQHHLSSLHNNCNTLLTVLAVVTCPLSALYRVFKKGFAKKKIQGDEEEQNVGFISQWLSWIRPDLLPLDSRTINDLQTTRALTLQLKLLDAQSRPMMPMALHAILMKEYALSILMLTQLAIQWQSRREQGSLDTDHSQAVTDVFSAWIDILLKSQYFTCALTRVMLPIMDRTETWEMFDGKKVIARTDLIPPWIGALFQSMSKFVTRILEPAIFFVLSKSEEAPFVEPLSHSLSDGLPCGCRFVNSDDRPFEDTDNSEIVAEGLYLLFNQLIEDMYSLPTAMLLFFKASYEVLSEKGVKNSNSCLGIKLVAGCIREILSNSEDIKIQLGCEISDSVRDNLKMLAECAYHILTCSSHGRGSGTPRIAGSFMKSNRNWLREQISVISEYFNNNEFEETNDIDELPSEHIEHLLISLTSSILSSASGERSLNWVYNFIHTNIPWILEQFDTSPILDSSSASMNHSLVVTTMSSEDLAFNPLDSFKKLDSEQINQNLLMEREYNWVGLLSADLGMTEVGFRALLFHRHELQGDAYVEETDLKHVNALRAMFDPEQAS